MEEDKEFTPVTDEYAWYALTRAQVRVNEVLNLLEKLQNTLKEQSDAQYGYVRHLERKLDAAQAENAKLREGVTNG